MAIKKCLYCGKKTKLRTDKEKHLNFCNKKCKDLYYKKTGISSLKGPSQPLEELLVFQDLMEDAKKGLNSAKRALRKMGLKKWIYKGEKII